MQKEYEEYPKKIESMYRRISGNRRSYRVIESGIAGKCFKVTEKKRGQYKWRNYM